MTNLPGNVASLLCPAEFCGSSYGRRITDELLFATIEEILGKDLSSKTVDVGEVKAVFWNVKGISRVKQDLLEIVASLEPRSYLAFDEEEPPSWSRLHREVLCFMSSPAQPRSSTHPQLLEWKLEGGGRVTRDLQYADKLRKKEDTLRTGYLAAFSHFEKTGKGMREVVDALANYMALKIDTLITESYFERHLAPVMQGTLFAKGSYWLLMDSPDTTPCTTRVLQECLRHAPCKIRGTYSEQCVDEFRSHAGYLNMNDVHQPETYDPQTARAVLEKSFDGFASPRSIATQEARLAQADAARRQNYQVTRREVHLLCPENKRQVVLSLVELASLASDYNERLREFRTKTLAALRDVMIKGGLDLKRTPLPEVLTYSER